MAASQGLPRSGEYATVIEGYTATLQHLGLIKQKREHLQAVQRQAETQHLKRISDAYYSSLINKDDLVLIYEEFKELTDPGYSFRWNSLMPMRAAEVDTYKRRQAYRRPNAPHGSWEGPYPFGSGPTPGEHACVVYILFDEANEPCYVGSTQHFRPRLHKHAADGKRFSYWRAYPCADRSAAYALEARLLQENKPYLNKRATA